MKTKKKPRIAVFILIAAIVAMFFVLPIVSDFHKDMRKTEPKTVIKTEKVIARDIVPESEPYKLAKLCMWGIVIVGCVKLLSRKR